MWSLFVTANLIIILSRSFVSCSEINRSNKHNKKSAGVDRMVKCSCGNYPAHNRSAIKFDFTAHGTPLSCTQTANDPLRGHCETDGLCRKQVEKIEGQKKGQNMMIYLDCVTKQQALVRLFEPSEPTVVSEWCSTREWWSNAVGCCKGPDFCNENLHMAVGGVYANPVFLKHVPIVHSTHDFVGVYWGYPCEDKSQCAWHLGSPYKQLCEPKWIPEISKVQKVCCGALLGEEKEGLSDKICCGSYTFCKENDFNSELCKCANKLGIRFDGEECVDHSDCAHHLCVTNPQLEKRVCCTKMNDNDECDPAMKVHCCLGPCVNNRCGRIPLLDDGEECTDSKQCAGLYCAPKLVKISFLSTGWIRKKVCCSRLYGQSCLPCARPIPCSTFQTTYWCDQCCGNLICGDDFTCACSVEQSVPYINTAWTAWAEPYSTSGLRLSEACSTGVTILARSRDGNYPFCPDWQLANLSPAAVAQIDAGQCPSQPNLFADCTQTRVLRGSILGYLGCLKTGDINGVQIRFLNRTISFFPMNPQICVQYCRSISPFLNPYKFAGVSGKWCGCAAEIYSDATSKLVLDATLCDTLCNGDVYAKCGGQIAFSVYCTDLIEEEIVEVEKPGFAPDGSDCNKDLECLHRICAIDALLDKRVCCSTKEVNDHCYMDRQIHCCYGRLCVDNKCVARLHDGQLCKKPVQCAGLYCAYKLTKNPTSGRCNQRKSCCSKVIGETCATDCVPPTTNTKCDPCCGNLKCIEGKCACRAPVGQAESVWSEWSEPEEYVIEACATGVAVMSRKKVLTDNFCPDNQIADLSAVLVTKIKARKCPSPAIRYKNCTAKLIDFGVELGYVGCLKRQEAARGVPAIHFLNETIGFRPMNNRICIQYCKTRNVQYKFAGVHGEFCGCAQEIYTFPQNGIETVSDTRCAFTCTGESRFNCGGTAAFSVYCTNL